MTSHDVPGEVGFLRVLRALAMIAIVVGATGSVALTLRFGHRNPSRVLIGMFVIWVLAPFAALLCAGMVSKRWPRPLRPTLDSLTLLVTVVSLAFYGNVAFGPPRPQPASIFLLVPLASLLVIAVAVTITIFMSRRPSD